MGKGSRRVGELALYLIQRYGALDKETLDKLKEFERAYSETGRLLHKIMGYYNELKKRNKKLSRHYQELEGRYQESQGSLEGHQELERSLQERCQGLERRLADVLIDKSAYEKRVEDLSEIIEEGSELNEDYRKRMEELERERRGLMYELHIAKAQISLDLPQNLGIRKVVIIGEGQFKLGEMDVPLSKYFADMLRARVVTIDENDWDKPKTISQSLQNAEFVVVVDAGRSGPPHNIRDMVYAQGITAENGCYIRMSERSSQAVSDILKKIIETKREDICAQ